MHHRKKQRLQKRRILYIGFFYLFGLWLGWTLGIPRRFPLTTHRSLRFIFSRGVRGTLRCGVKIFFRGIFGWKTSRNFHFGMRYPKYYANSFFIFIYFNTSLTKTNIFWGSVSMFASPFIFRHSKQKHSQIKELV